MDTPTEDVSGLLDNLCGNDVEMRNYIDDFLSIDVDKEFLTSRPIEVGLDRDNELKGNIGRIKIQKLLAQGGMGQVYLGIDEVLKRQVAIKVMHTNLNLSKRRREAFLIEAQILSSLQHPNICQVYDFFQENDKDVLVLELIEGKTLRQIIDQKVTYKPIEIAAQITEALMAAHEHGIIHRDLKPDNIMLTDQGTVKILDFGLSHSVVEKNKPKFKEPLNRQPKQISGTPGYISPEQARGELSTSASDMWSLGIVLCELLTKTPPYPINTTSKQLFDFAKQAKVLIPKQLAHAETILLEQLFSAQVKHRPTARAALNSLTGIKNRTTRRIKFFTLFCLITLVLFGFWKYTSDLQEEKKISQQALLIAKQERATAEQARLDAENLLSFMLNDLHTGLRSVGQLHLLKSVANKAMNYYSNLSEQRLQDSQGQSAIAMLRISEVLTDSGYNNKAISVIEQAHSTMKQVHLKQPDNPLVNYRLGVIKYNLGDLYKLAGKFEFAEENIRAAVDIGKQLTKGLEPGLGPSNKPNATQRWRLLLRSLYLLADTNTRIGNGEQAYKILETVVQLAIPAAKINPDLTINLSDIQFKRCDAYYELSLWSEILQPCLEVLKLDLALFNNNPNNYESHKNLLGDYTFLTNVYRSLNRFEEGLENANEGIRLGTLLIDRDPDNVNTKNEFVSTLLAKARLLLVKGEIQAAEKLFTQAYDIIIPISQDHEEITYLNHAFITLVHLGKNQQANSVATVLDLRGFKRRDFKELCEKHQIPACMESYK